MNIDMSFDYDKLLDEAKYRYEKILELSDKAQVAFMSNDAATYNSARAQYDKACEEWNAWCQENIENRGLRLERDIVNRDIPIGISATLSGRKFFR